MPLERIEELLVQHIEPNKKIVKIDFTNLVGPGENFGGEVYKIEVSLKDGATQENEVLHVVGKTIPTDEFSRSVFNIQQTFNGELQFYQTIVPILQSFQRENGITDVIDCFPKCYGGRLNLNGDKVVDKDAVILMENLIASGYKNLDRHVGYNLEEAKVLLKDLAEMQAIPIAIKIKKPEVFKNDIRPLCTNQLNVPKEDPFAKIIFVIKDIYMRADRLVRYIPKVEKCWAKYHSSDYKYETREPFATLSHCDLWVNNAMMKHKDGKPVKNKFVDFQLYDYRSPAGDVLNFLATSVQTNVLKEHFEELLKYYHKEFISILKQLDCDSSAFSYNIFKKELALDAPGVFSWAVSFVPLIVFGKKDVSPPSVDGPVDFEDQKVRDEILKNLPHKAEERLYFLLEEFVRRNWL